MNVHSFLRNHCSFTSNAARLVNEKKKQSVIAFITAASRALPLIAFEQGSGTRDLIDGWFRRAGFEVTPVMQLGSIEAIKRMVSSGLGYSIIPRMAVEAVRDREGLHVCSLSPVLHRQLAVMMRQDRVLSKGIAEIVRLLQRAS